MKNNFKALIQILKQLNYILNRSQKKKAFWLLIVIMIGSGLELLGVTIVLPFVEAVVSPDKMLQNKYIMKIAHVIEITNANKLLLIMGIGIILIYIVKNVFLLYANYVQYDFASRIQKELSVKMLCSYMSRPYTFFLNINTSEILRGCTSDTEGVYI